MGSWKSPLNSSDSSCARAFRAITGMVSYWDAHIASIWGKHGAQLTLKGLFDVNGLLGTRLEIWHPALRLAERHRALRRDHALALLDIDLVPENHLRKPPLARHAHLTRRRDLERTKGKLSGSRGDAWIRNSSLQLSSASKLLELLTSKTRTQQSAPR